MKQFDMRHAERSFDVLYGTPRSQVAVMVLDVGQKTGGPQNQHADADQWLYVIAGEGRAVVNGEPVEVRAGALLLIEAGETHEIVNTGDQPLQTFNIYAPPEY